MLNEFHYRQDGRAIMEDKQFKQYPFFRKIGAVPINRDDSRQAVKVLQQSAKFLSLPKRSLYFFPQGEIFTECDELKFESGLAKLSEMTEYTDIVPLAISITTIRSDKPELFIRTGPPVDVSGELQRKQRTAIFEKTLRMIWKENQAACKTGSESYKRLI